MKFFIQNIQQKLRVYNLFYFQNQQIKMFNIQNKLNLSFMRTKLSLDEKIILTRQERLRKIAQSLTNEQVVRKPAIMIDSNMRTQVQRNLSGKSYKLLNKQIQQILKADENDLQKKQSDQDHQFQSMKHKLVNYGKNRLQFLVDKIIRVSHKPYKIRIKKYQQQNNYIANQYNMKLSQKIDAITQMESINKIKQQRISFLNNKLPQPLVNRLKAIKSAHIQRKELVRTERSQINNIFHQINKQRRFYISKTSRQNQQNQRKNTNFSNTSVHYINKSVHSTPKINSISLITQNNRRTFQIDSKPMNINLTAKDSLLTKKKLKKKNFKQI